MIGATQIVSSLYQERGQEVTLLSCWIKADVRRAAVSIVPGGRGSCRTKAKLGRSLSLPLKSQAGSFQPAARLSGRESRLNTF